MRFIEVKRSGLASRPHSTLVSCHIMTWKWREGEWMRCVRSVCSLSHLREHPYWRNTRLTVLLGHIYIISTISLICPQSQFQMAHLWSVHWFSDGNCTQNWQALAENQLTGWLYTTSSNQHAPILLAMRLCLQGPGLLQWVLFEEESQAVIDIKSLKDTQY